MATKKKIRYCDRCGKQLEERKPTDNPHDLIKLGFKVGNCQSVNWTKDICLECADAFDKWWANE